MKFSLAFYWGGLLLFALKELLSFFSKVFLVTTKGDNKPYFSFSRGVSSFCFSAIYCKFNYLPLKAFLDVENELNVGSS
jgi:hypothetical protein